MVVRPRTEFQDSLEEQGSSWTGTTTEEFAETVAEAVVEPAVAVDLSEWGLDFGDAPVTVDPTPTELLEARTGVAGVSAGIASYGTLVVPSDGKGTEPVSLYPERHVAVVRESDLLEDVPAGIDRVADEYAAGRDSVVLATGPSSTGDMGALVPGVHGPKQVHVVIVEDR